MHCRRMAREKTALQLEHNEVQMESDCWFFFFLEPPRAAGWVLVPVEPYKKTAQIFDVV